jgi:ABC-2 type transport system ATP-binding protein
LNTADVVRTHGLTKQFAGGLLAVDGIDLQVRQGDLFGFLGPNGAGKTTTIRMLLGLTRPTSGSIEVLGHDVARHAHDARQGVGAMVEGPAFYPYLSGTRNLIIFDGAGAGGSATQHRANVTGTVTDIGVMLGHWIRHGAVERGRRKPRRLRRPGIGPLPRQRQKRPHLRARHAG